MNKDFLKHYLKGGYFRAIYNPTSLDVSHRSLQSKGKIVEICANMIISPIITPLRYANQHSFNCDKLDGWSPEEDFKILEKLDKYKDKVEPLPQYMYKLTFTDQSKLYDNFGKGDWKVPMVVGREYSFNADDYILKLSNPQADKIEKAVYNGDDDNIIWEELVLNNVN